MSYTNEQLEDYLKKNQFKNIDDVLSFILKMMLNGVEINELNKHLIVANFKLKNIKELNEKINSNWLNDEIGINNSIYEPQTLKEIDNTKLISLKQISSIFDSYKIGFGILILVNLILIISLVFLYFNVIISKNIVDIKNIYENYSYLFFILISFNFIGLLILYKSSNLKIND